MLVVSTAFEAVERIRRGLVTRHVVVRCASVEAALGELQRLHATGEAGAPVRPLAGLIVEAVDAEGRPTVPVVARARDLCARGPRGPRGTRRACLSGRAREAPGPEETLRPSEEQGVRADPIAPRRDDLPVIALVRRSARWCAGTVALMEARPTMVAIAEDLDLGSVLRALTDRIHAADLVASVWDELEDEVPVALRPLLRYALARADGPLSVQRLADGMGMHRKTLWSRCRREGVANVQALVTWCRLLAAEHVLRTCTRPLDAVAEELAFSSPTALRNAIRQHVGTTATALRQPGAPRAVSEGFRMWMRGRRCGGLSAGAAPPVMTAGDMR